MQPEYEADAAALSAQRFAPHKTALVGILGGCTYSAWRFKVRGPSAVTGLGVRSVLVGLGCSALSGGYLWWNAVQARRHSEALDRLRRTSEVVRLVPMDGGAPPLPAEEFDQATGQNALEANAELFAQLRQAERAERAGGRR